MASTEVWKAYLEFFNNEPKDASQLQAFSKKQADLPDLNFKQAKDCLEANKGKGAGAAESKQPEASGGGS
eukprot:CAMPEP_0202686182 /NCGR_PEP_ID=MMETSP1385-20130828/1986_1 /ASSEMBLY_ACC=CAM_ASM_000861 /TAXON_ID=933848 /ORGANISM="Elphidium margaritaceum" /LENGTH=69 /DNA_ID=CAMNT_0049340709 /DNA_START=58 /DNA_END=264 /DNA_ORIENTATION=+